MKQLKGSNMAYDLTFTTAEQKILDTARDETDAEFDNDLGTVETTSTRNHDCLIHATLGQKNDKGLYFAESHQEIRKFLFDIVSSFTDDDLNDNSEIPVKLREFMQTIGKVAPAACEGYAGYREQLCDFEDSSNKTRFLEISEIYLLAILENAYILNWTRNDKKLRLAKGNAFPPNPELRELLMAHIAQKKIAVPAAIADCNSKPIRAIHIENTKQNHFSRVQWHENQINDEMTVPNVAAAIKLYNEKLNPKPKKNDEPKKEAPASAVTPVKPEPPKVTPNPVRNAKIEHQGNLTVNDATVTWSDDEKKKIYRNNINFLLHMLAQQEDNKKNFMAQLVATPMNGSTVYRDAKSVQFFYTKIHAHTSKDIGALLIENIDAYEKLKSLKHHSGNLLKQYQELKSVVQTAKEGGSVLDDAKAETFKSHAFVRTQDKQEYIQTKTWTKVQPDSTRAPISMLHRKASDSKTKGTQYHMEGLGNLKAAAQWINEDMPKAKHILKQGSQQYRLYISQDPKNPERYLMFKCAVDAKGEYKKNTNQLAITPDEEALWSKEIEGVFKGYSEYKKIQLFTGGFQHKPK